MAKSTINHGIGRRVGFALGVLFTAAALWGTPRSIPTGPTAPPAAALGADPAARGGLEAVLARSQRGLRWVSRRLSFAEPLGAALGELLHAVGEARRSAGLGKRLDALLARVQAIEEKLALEIDNREELARLRDMLGRLGQELRDGSPYKLCCDSLAPRLGRPLR
jgi:hypothetical protein